MIYQHILIAMDDSPTSYTAVDDAIELAQLCKSRVTIVNVVAVDPMIGVDFYKVIPAVTDYFIEAEQTAKARLHDIHERFMQAGIDTQLKIHHGSAAEGILFVADEISADLIVMGSHGRTGVKKLMLGSVAQSVLEQSHIPVLVVKH